MEMVVVLVLVLTAATLFVKSTVYIGIIALAWSIGFVVLAHMISSDYCVHEDDGPTAVRNKRVIQAITWASCAAIVALLLPSVINAYVDLYSHTCSIL